MIVKLQCDATGRSILVKEEGGSYAAQLHGTLASIVRTTYDMPPMSRTWVSATVTDEGVLNLGDVCTPPATEDPHCQ